MNRWYGPLSIKISHVLHYENIYEYINTVYDNDAAKKILRMTFPLAAKLEAKQKLMEQTDIVIILRAV